MEISDELIVALSELYPGDKTNTTTDSASTPMANLAFDPSRRTLPPELECYIFEIAAEEDRAVMVQLVLIAHRVQIWIEPLLYRLIHFTTSSMFEKFSTTTIDSRPAEFFANSVKSIIFDYFPTVEKKARVLSVCKGLRELYDAYILEIPLNIFSDLRLRKLHANLQILKDFPLDYFTLPAFAELTHLEIYDYPDVWPTFQFGLLPSLTHLSIVTYAAEEWDDAGVRLVSNALANCALLEVLLLNVKHPEPETCEVDIRRRLASITDPRLVLLHPTQGSRTDMFWKHWRRADERVAERMRNAL